MLQVYKREVRGLGEEEEPDIFSWIIWHFGHFTTDMQKGEIPGLTEKEGWGGQRPEEGFSKDPRLSAINAEGLSSPTRPFY